MTRFTYDEETGRMYVYLDHPEAGQEGSVGKTIPNFFRGANVDLGHDSHPIGIELQNIERITDDDTEV